MKLKLIHWLLIGGLLHLVQRGRAWAGCGPAQCPSRCTKCYSPLINGQCTDHRIAFNGPLLCDFNVTIKGLTECRGNCSATSNNMKLVDWPLMGGLLHLVQQGGAWTGCGPAQAPPRCTKCNSPPISTASAPITVLLYNGPLLCGFNVPVKGLTTDVVFLILHALLDLCVVVSPIYIIT